MSLSERQEHFRYGSIASEWKFLEPPTLDSSILEAMRREGLDEQYRIIWGGVAIYRTNPKSFSGEIKGDERATEVNSHSRRLQPTYLYGRAKQTLREVWVYKDGLGREVETENRDLIPAGYVCRQKKEYVYIEFGVLRWHVEAYCNGAWHWIQTIEADEGLYLDADSSIVHVLRKREHENRNEDLKEVVKRDREYRAKVRRDREALEEKKKREMAAQMTKDALDRAIRQITYSMRSTHA